MNFPADGAPPFTGGGFSHAVLIVGSDDTLRRRLVPELRRLLNAGDSVLMVVSEHTASVVRDALGEHSDLLEWGAIEDFYQRLGFAYENFRRFVAARHDAGTRVHVVAEPNVHTDPDAPGPIDRVAAYLSYESFCNETYAAYGCPVTCLWDSRNHPALVIEEIRNLHDHELTDHGLERNPGYIGPGDFLAHRDETAPPAPPEQIDCELHALETRDLQALRAGVRGWACGQGFSLAAAADVVAATSEIVANGLIHGTAPVVVRCWHEADVLIAQVEDAGALDSHRIPPTAGYRRPSDDAEDSRGLWIARQLADAVVVYATGDRTAVRLYFPFGVTHKDLAKR
jgi:anti-sigma regulatory factor (Ser/Thr protein kinase)